MTTAELVAIVQPLLPDTPHEMTAQRSRGYEAWWRDAAEALAKRLAESEASCALMRPLVACTSVVHFTKRRVESCVVDDDLECGSIDDGCMPACPGCARVKQRDAVLATGAGRAAMAQLAAADGMREALAHCRVLLRHKEIRPPLAPGLQEALEKDADDAIAAYDAAKGVGR